MGISTSPGVWRGLKATSSNSNRFSILAFDQRGNYRRMLPPDASYETAAQIKRDVVVALAPYVDAVLLDPIYGLAAALDMPGDTGLLMAIEKTGYAGNPTERRVDFMDGWTINKIKRLGASAVKLLVYYHPEAGTAGEVEETVRSISAQCRQYDLPLFVEPLLYSLNDAVPESSAEFAAQRPELALETARRLGGLGVDVLKLEFPVDVRHEPDRAVWQRACEALTEASPVPWVLLSAGVDYDVFREQVEVACAAGASGFLGGRAIWKEAITLSPEERARFLRETAAARLESLREIVERSARPWSDYFDSPAATEDWFLSYQQMP
ncbi:MAG: tagatose 1,6-diphosphate aldolase [Chloroflexota bacterium]|nr:MAG: hypothetical protein DIU68_03250 [Chloroflexota bacterium]